MGGNKKLLQFDKATFKTNKEIFQGYELKGFSGTASYNLSIKEGEIVGFTI